VQAFSSADIRRYDVEGEFDTEGEGPAAEANMSFPRGSVTAAAAMAIPLVSMCSVAWWWSASARMLAVAAMSH